MFGFLKMFHHNVLSVIAPTFLMEMEFCNDLHENTLTFHHIPEIQLDEMLRKLHLKIGS